MTTLLGSWGQCEGREGHDRTERWRLQPRSMEHTLVQRSLKDDSFRQRLLDDPKGTVEQEQGAGCQRASR